MLSGNSNVVGAQAGETDAVERCGRTESSPGGERGRFSGLDCPDKNGSRFSFCIGVYMMEAEAIGRSKAGG